VGQKDLAPAEGLIDAVYVAGEILSVAQDNTPLPDAAGERIRIEPASRLGIHKVVTKHLMDAVIDSLEQNC